MNFTPCSVLLNIYIRPGTMPEISIPTINAAFSEGVRLAAADADSTLIRQFLGRNAIIISNDTYGMIEQNVHPGSFIRGGVRFPVEEDPVLNAIILGYWAREFTSY